MQFSSPQVMKIVFHGKISRSWKLCSAFYWTLYLKTSIITSQTVSLTTTAKPPVDNKKMVARAGNNNNPATTQHQASGREREPAAAQPVDENQCSIC